MPYRNQKSIVVPKETKELFRKIKKENETWEDLILRIVKSEEPKQQVAPVELPLS